MIIDFIKKYFSFKPFWWWGTDTKIAEVISTFALWVWGLVLILPIESFSETGYYKNFLSLASEEMWALVFIFAATLQSFAMCGNIYYFRLPAAVIACILFMFISTVTFFTNPWIPASYIHLIFVLTNIYVILRGPSKT